MRKRRRRRGPDRGTPEQQLRKALMARGGDPRLLEYPLGTLLMKKCISMDQHNAGLWYAGLYRACIGRAGMRQPVGPREMTEEADLAVQQHFEAAVAALKNCGGRAVKNIVDNICVFEMTPAWLTVGGRRQRLDIQAGLQALAEWKNKGQEG